jgi:hypothetical protein
MMSGVKTVRMTNYGTFQKQFNNLSAELKVMKILLFMFSIHVYGQKDITVCCKVKVHNHHAMKTHEGVKVKLNTFLTLAVDGGEWSASCSSLFIHEERVPNIHWAGSWVGLQTWSGHSGREKNPFSYQELNPVYGIILVHRSVLGLGETPHSYEIQIICLEIISEIQIWK